MGVGVGVGVVKGDWDGREVLGVQAGLHLWMQPGVSFDEGVVLEYAEYTLCVIDVEFCPWHFF
jgi:hypothetical protein